MLGAARLGRESKEASPRVGAAWWGLLVLRSAGLIATLGAIFWHTGSEVNSRFGGGVALALVGLALHHTWTGRRLLCLGWLGLVGVIALNLAINGTTWETVKALLVALAVGALWFVDWSRLLVRLYGSRFFLPAEPRGRSSRQEE